VPGGINGLSCYIYRRGSVLVTVFTGHLQIVATSTIALYIHINIIYLAGVGEMRTVLNISI
jgi:hypothetical protein